MGETPRRLRVARAVSERMRSQQGTVQALAHATGIPVDALNRRLAGEVAFDVDELELIATALGTPTSELFTDGDAT